MDLAPAAAIGRRQAGVGEEKGLRAVRGTAAQEAGHATGSPTRGEGQDRRPEEPVPRHGTHEHLGQHGSRKFLEE